MRIGLYGGSFNPIHHGHRLMAQAAKERLDLDRMIFIPAARPPHKSDGVADARHRLEMVRLAVADMPGYEVSDIELNRPGASYTIVTVELMRDIHRGAELYWLIGADTLAELDTWYRIGELADLCTFVTVGRPGCDTDAGLARLGRKLSAAQVERIAAHILRDVPLVEISANEIRRRVAEGRSIRWHVPEAVAEYIAAHGLFK